MSDSLLFIGIARQQGYSVAAAQAALATVRGTLRAAGVVARRFYIFRTGDGGVGSEGGGEHTGRPRLLLAFQSADAALAFAQRVGLAVSPRLVGLSLGQVLAAMIQRPAIVSLLVVDEEDGPLAPGALPHGTRIERATLVALLTEVTS